jgi:hypothetical protein
MEARKEERRMDADDPSQKENLSAAQRAALEALWRGETVAVAAAAAGVHRRSVHNRLRNHFAFQAQFNRERRHLQEQMTARLMRPAEKATAGVEHHLDDPDAAICMKARTTTRGNGRQKSEKREKKRKKVQLLPARRRQRGGAGRPRLAASIGAHRHAPAARKT